MVGLAGIEIAAHGHGPGAIARVHEVVASQRTRLLDEQSNQYGEKTHRTIITGRAGTPATAQAALKPP